MDHMKLQITKTKLEIQLLQHQLKVSGCLKVDDDCWKNIEMVIIHYIYSADTFIQSDLK